MAVPIGISHWQFPWAVPVGSSYWYFPLAVPLGSPYRHFPLACPINSPRWQLLSAFPIGMSHWQFPLAIGYYPSILRVEHPAVRYKAVEGGTQEVEAKPSELRFFDKHKGVCVGFCRSIQPCMLCLCRSTQPFMLCMLVSAHCYRGQVCNSTSAKLVWSPFLWQPVRSVHIARPNS